jgi:hypothetical protein
MNDAAMSSGAVEASSEASWRLTVPADMPFIYDLVTQVDPRWWRFSRHGLEPSRLLAVAQATSAGATVVDGFGKPVACALLSDTGTSGTGTLEYFALPDPDSQALASRFAPELIGATFGGAPIRRLYHERFENDQNILGVMAKLFELEVTYPEFAMIDGHLESRTISVITVDKFAAWQRGEVA